MATFFTDFTEYADGVIPSDWTAWWNATGDWERILSETDILPAWAPALHKDNSSGSTESACTWDEVGTPGDDVETLGVWQTTQEITETIGPAFRVSGGAGTETGYVFNLYDLGNALQLRRYNAGAKSLKDSYAFTIAIDTAYWIRAQCLIEGANVRLRARIWETGDPEPAVWHIDWVDTSPLADGPVGMAQYRRTNGNYLYQLGVGTGGDQAPATPTPGGGGVGTTPELSVGNIGINTAQLSVGESPFYYEVEFVTYLGVAILDQATQTGEDRHLRTLTGLTADTVYSSWARVRYSIGWSPWAGPVEWRTLPASLITEDLGCPPTWSGIHVNADANPPDNRLGVGWYRPQAGEPLRGTVELVLRFPTSGVQWNFELSDDLGATYPNVIATNVQGGSVDGDNLFEYKVSFDTTAFSDGTDYRLKAISQNTSDDDIESLSFLIDNAGDAQWWKQAYGSLDERFGKVWEQEGDSPDGTIWVHGRDGGIGALRGHGMACYADRLVPLCEGADVTIKFYLWSSEGGRFYLQGRSDVEGFNAGIAFFANGLSSAAQKGIFFGIENPVAWAESCCQGFLTSYNAEFSLLAAVNEGDPFSKVWGQPWASEPVRKMYFKSVMTPPAAFRLDPEIRARWPTMTWREGPIPGVDVRTKEQSCARRYEAYTLRCRAELDPADAKRLRIRARVDGLGVEEPAAGYWHVDEWVTSTVAFEEGSVGFASSQIENGAFGTPSGARVFLNSSILPLNPGYENDVPGDTPPAWNPTEPGEPCTLVLQHYAEDRERVLWEVGTDPQHENPYLLNPENYGEQEIDVVEGAASIGQVEVILADVRRIPGDQDSGWVTKRLGVGSVGAIQGRRERLLRYISPALGWVVIADGPAGTPFMDESYSAYRWTIRDTRDTERKIRAFVKADTSWLLPMGVEPGFGEYTDQNGNTQWIVDPAEPIWGTFEVDTTFGGLGVTYGIVDCNHYWPNGVGIGKEVDEELVVSEAAAAELKNEYEILGDPMPYIMRWPNTELLWRPRGSSDDWTVIEPYNYVPEKYGYVQPQLGGPTLDAKLADGTEVLAVSGSVFLMGNGAQGTFPADKDEVEVAIRYIGPPTEDFPLHIEGLTPGEFLKKGYDGEYSEPDPVTGEFVPSNVRYNEEDLLACGCEGEAPGYIVQEVDGVSKILQEDGFGILTEDSSFPPATVRFRATEVVEDFRAWAEEHVYSPIGSCPALNNDAEISPKGQIPPSDFSGLTQVTNAITEPQPDWDAGERIINILTYTYPRWYRPTIQQATSSGLNSVDRLKAREVTIQYRDESSVLRHDTQEKQYDGDVYSDVGDSYGRSILQSSSESGQVLAGLRRLYVFDRYRNAAPTIQVPVRRDSVATLRAGDWVVIDLSWFPDYTPQESPGAAELARRRGLVAGAQILAIADLDCEWRLLLLEEAFPIVEES